MKKTGWRKCAVLLAAFWATGCSRDMAEQPSFQPQQAPRLHSPAGSVPLESRSALPFAPAPTLERVTRGAALFAINCSPCHGKNGSGEGTVAPFLVLPPANLRAEPIQRMSAAEIYDVVTRGRIVMPSFQGVLSAQERWDAAYFVKSSGLKESG